MAKQVTYAEVVGMLAEPASPGKPVSYHISDYTTRDMESLVHRLAAELTAATDGNVLPLVISPPKRFLDTGAVAVTQAAVGLMNGALANGELSAAVFAETPWSVKLDALKTHLRQDTKRLVLLLDSPREWTLSNPDPSDAYFGEHTVDVADLFEVGLECTLAICGVSRHRASQHFTITSTTETYEQWLNDPTAWGGLRPFAEAVWGRFGESLCSLGQMEVRLLVAIAAMQEGLPARAWDAASMPAILAELLWQRPNSLEMRKVWRRISMLRGSFTDELLSGLSPDKLGQPYRGILLHCLLVPRNGGWYLPSPLRRRNLMFPVSAEPGEDDRQWHLKVADWYRGQVKPCQDGKWSPRDYIPTVEALFHGTVAADRSLLSGDAFFFPEQLNALGRALSRAKDYEAAVAAFRRSLKWDPDDDYANHYLAFNFDIRGLDRETVEKHYKRAVELEPLHVWWWSRWVCFLITLGRTKEAERAWAQAVESLGIPAETESDVSTYFHLHAWVARLLLRRGQVDFAQRVLAGIPDAAIAQDNAQILVALKTLHGSLVEAQRSHAVLPVGVDPTGWWTWQEPPLVDVEPEHNGKPRRDWLPGRIDSVDGNAVHIVVGLRPEAGQPPEVGDIALPLVAFQEACAGSESLAIEAGRFVILAFYGEDDELAIRLMPRVPLRLPREELDPMRYINRRWGVNT